MNSTVYTLRLLLNMQWIVSFFSLAFSKIPFGLFRRRLFFINSDLTDRRECRICRERRVIDPCGSLRNSGVLGLMGESQTDRQ